MTLKKGVKVYDNLLHFQLSASRELERDSRSPAWLVVGQQFMQMWSGSSATFYAKLFHVGTKNKYLDLAIFKIADCILAPLTSVATTPVQGMAFRKTEAVFTFAGGNR